MQRMNINNVIRWHEQNQSVDRVHYDVLMVFIEPIHKQVAEDKLKNCCMLLRTSQIFGVIIRGRQTP